MKSYTVTVILKFKINSDADAMCDAQWDASKYIQEHIMDDEDENSIEWMDSVFVLNK